MGKKKSAQIIIKNLVLFIGFFLLLFSIAAVIQNFNTIYFYYNRGEKGFEVEPAKTDSSLIITEIQNGLGAQEVGLAVGDTIYKINSSSVTHDKNKLREMWGPNTIGNKVTITIKKNNSFIDYTIEKRRDTLDNLVVSTFYLASLPLMLLAYIFVGLWGLLKNQYSSVLGLISLVCFTFGILVYTPLDLPHTNSFILTYLYFYEIKGFLTNFIFFVPSFWILLFLVFPVRNEYYEKHKKRLIPLIFFIPFLTVTIYLLGQLIKIPKTFSTILTLIFLIYIFVGISVGIIILIKSSKKINNTYNRRQFRLILFGIKFGGISTVIGWMMLLVILTIFKSTIPSQFVLWILLFFLMCQMGGLIIPFTFLNTFYGNRILETEWILKKKLFYFSATIVLFIVYFVIAYFICNLFISLLHLSDSSLIIIIATVIATTFYPINKKFQNMLVTKLFPERTKYQRDIKEFSKTLQSMLEIKTLLQNLSNWLEQNFNIKPAIAFALGGKKENIIPFKPIEKNSIVTKIKDGSVFFWDEAYDKKDIQLDESEKDWILKNNISLTIPLISYGECVGVLNIGKKTNNEDFNGNDIEILKEAASQSAIALQNLQLQSEYIEKKRLDKELNVARVIQSQLLPQSIPPVKGLDLYGKMRPCFEVAGDYFDILPMDENKTVLALADVSGKGAGAALLMSNLQAGIRSALRFTQDLSNIVYEINNIINQNTSPEQFITFFMGIWDARDKSFQYVNAGHNPALIIKPDGKVIKLEATGFFLGPIPHMQYTSEKVVLSKDDILIIYTDGIEETFNPKEEQFGVENIIQTIHENHSSTPKEIGTILYSKIENFSEGLPNSDDATVIIAKVLE
jgi:serine phosphatase RsbU (regulator of sigma subunit)